MQFRSVILCLSMVGNTMWLGVGLDLGINICCAVLRSADSWCISVSI